MKTLFIEAKSDKTIKLPKDLIDKLPNKIALFTAVQFIDNKEQIIKQLKDKTVIKIKPKHCQYECQLLGCSIEQFNIDADAFLYVGDGMFHPKALMLKNDKPVFVYNPFSEKYFELDKKDIEIIKRKQKGALAKFYTSTEIGVLVSTKPGQNKLAKAEKLKEKYADKNFYILVSDTIDFNSLADFNFIECFVNTACPRIAYDDSIKLPKPVIDIDDLF